MSVYNEKSIQVFRGLDGVRKRPSMYIGPTNAHGLWVLCKEVVDNGVDEFLAGRNKIIHVIKDQDTMYVLDAGAGIPVGIHEKSGVSTLTTVVSELHAGGKFDDKAYAGGSIGTHGLGVSCVNALSEYFQVWTKRDGKWYTTEFSKGVEVSPVRTCKAPHLPLGVAAPRGGTVVAFRPDRTVFGVHKFPAKLLLEWAELTSHINGGLRIKLTSINGTKEYHYPNGIADYLSLKLSQLKTEGIGKPIVATTENLDVALQFTNYDGGEAVEAYTNSSRNVDGGVHMTALWTALTRALKPWAGRNTYNPLDLRDGVVGLINYKISSPQFSSQTKEKLVDDRVKKPCEETLFQVFSEFFESNKTLAKSICKRASDLRSLRDEVIANKKAVMSLKTTSRSLLPGKLSDASRCSSQEREIFLVEGQSAGGCFTGDTPVLLADGSTIRFDQMVAAAEWGNVSRGVGYDLCTKQDIPFDFVEPRITRHEQQLVTVSMSDGTTVRCTYDHPWLLESGTYLRADCLCEGQMLRTLLNNTIYVKGTQITVLPYPIPVYDATNPEQHNFALGNGVVVHNTAKQARYNKFQSVLPLKGKILNVMRVARQDRVFNSEEVLNILQSIGFNPSNANPLASLRVGKILLLADPDPDGPVFGNTRVLTLDGRNPTIKELAEQWKKDQKPIWVYSRDVEGNLVPAQAIKPHHALTTTEIVKVTFDDGTVLRCTPEHKWRVNAEQPQHAGRTVSYKGQPYIKAANLKAGDSINSVYLEDRAADGNKGGSGYTCIMNEPSCDRRIMPVHHWVKMCEDPNKFNRYRQANVGAKGGAVHIHHHNEDTYDNSPENLRYLKRVAHYREHGSRMAKEYNGSQKHLDDLQRFQASPEGKRNRKKASRDIIRYNKSEEHRKLTAEMNCQPEQIRRQLLGKASRIYLAVLKVHGKVDRATWTSLMRSGGLGWDNLVSRFTRKEILQYIGEKVLTEENAAATTASSRRIYPTQKVSKFISVCKTVLEKGHQLNRENYLTARQERGVRGDPKWETGLSWLGTNGKDLAQFVKNYAPKNHKVVKVERVTLKEATPMYCLSVPETGNFMVADKSGNGICSGNCHINALILTLFARFIPGIFARGLVYVVNAPKYVLKYKGSNYFANSIDEMRKVTPRGAPVQNTQYIKGYGESVHFSTLIPTDRGIIPIKEVNAGFAAATTSSDSVVEQAFYYPKKPTLSIRTQYGYGIKASPNHKVLVLQPSGILEWVKAKDLSEGDELVLQRGYNIWSKITPKFYTGAVHYSSTNYGPTTIQTPDRMTKDLARLLGYYIADGWDSGTSIAPGGSYEQAKDIERCYLSCFGGIKVSISNPTGACFTVKVGKGASAVAGFFTELGLRGLTAQHKCIPDCIMRSPKKYVVEFLRGLFEGDGYINNTVTEYYTASNQLAFQLKSVLLNLGIVVTHDHHAYRFNPFTGNTDRVPANTLYITSNNIDLFMREIGCVTQEKKDRIFAVKRNTNTDTIPYYGEILRDFKDKNMLAKGFYMVAGVKKRIAFGQQSAATRLTYSWVDGNMQALIANCDILGAKVADSIRYIMQYRPYFDKVKSIRDIGYTEHCDLTLPTADYLRGSSYVANGFNVHNCSATALREIAFNPETRKLTKILGPSRKDLVEFNLLMSDNVDYRKTLLGI